MLGTVRWLEISSRASWMAAPSSRVERSLVSAGKGERGGRAGEVAQGRRGKKEKLRTDLI